MLQKWPVVIYVTLAMASPQFPVPMSYPMMAYPQMFPMIQQPPQFMLPMLPQPSIPMPVPMPMPMQIIVIPDEANSKPPTLPNKNQEVTEPPGSKESATPSTPPSCTSANNIPPNTKPPPNASHEHIDNIAIGVPMPLAVPMPIPAPMPPPMSMLLPAPHPMSMPLSQPMPRPPPPPMPLPQPMPRPMPLPQPVPMPLVNTMPIPLPQPQPVQFAIPSLMPPFCKKNNRHPSCPPCPPCLCNPCTPAFYSYCSTCHLQCRCRQGEAVPIPKPPIPPLPLPGPAYPLPLPLPPPGPLPLPDSPHIILIPFPPQMTDINNFNDNHHHHHSQDKPNHSKKPDSSSHDDDSSDTDSAERRKKTFDIYRRSNGYDLNDDSLVKPVLNYLTEDGEVKIRKALSKNEVNQLIDDGDTIEKVHLLVSDNESDGKPQIKTAIDRLRSYQIYKKKLLNQGTWQQTMHGGKQKLLFMLPIDKTISNLSVTFNVEG